MSVKGRVIAGKYRSRPLLLVFDKVTRATKERVKEAMFSALSKEIKDSVVLDLFAGTGALGIEALSRGAKKAIFCENSAKTVQILSQNLLIVEEDYELFKDNYEDKIIKMAPKSVDIVLVDPPYNYNIAVVLDNIYKAKILKDRYTIVLETDKEFTGDLNNVKIRQYKYGLTHLTIIRGEQ